MTVAAVNCAEERDDACAITAGLSTALLELKIYEINFHMLNLLYCACTTPLKEIKLNLPEMTHSNTEIYIKAHWLD